ncbi:MAG TPA: hypothetical protein DCS07_00385 [Bdellovibrionales bacterium]|nr:MAG: hypothetical protein A2X97_06315 [Bdellovibrionales bacterium GWA1_52_35]OFZ42921.1 MAG: hypothetical protein A2070_04640 [Bdellovibrionales bacterium GWC1_52_8]HAR41087.1 hypothetical protein [Bdellovibrionales bacterium]HCM40896.1 hypothetical protein [Bdellovibrionales bacterium]
MRRIRILCIIFLIISIQPHPRAYAAEYDEGFSNETSAGILALTGNSPHSTLDLRQTNYYRWLANSARFQAFYLRGSAKDELTAKYWSAAVRFDSSLSETFGVYAEEEFRGNPFAGFAQQFDSTGGLRQILYRSEWMTWATEAGYRYTIQNRNSDDQRKFHYLRGYTEAIFPWSWRTNALLWLEGLPNLTEASYWQANAGTAITALLTEILSLRLTYVLRYSNEVLPPARQKLDTIFVTSLVVKW